MFTVEEISKRYDVKFHTVLGWIKNGELRAINVGRTPGKLRPRWRISQAALDAFEAARAATLRPTPTRKARRPAAAVVKFYS